LAPQAERSEGVEKAGIQKIALGSILLGEKFEYSLNMQSPDALHKLIKKQQYWQ
jgi:hypothetical protein